MANWCNARLIVAGRTADVVRFRRVARARPSVLFREDMLQGEAQELFSERATALGSGLLAKHYIFQIRSDDGLEHFLGISQSRPQLSFILVYGFDNEYGSHFIVRGRARSYLISDRVMERVMTKHGADDNPDNEWAFQPHIDAEVELMDLAEARWHNALERSTSRSGSPTR